jgi:hypothetical protein
MIALSLRPGSLSRVNHPCTIKIDTAQAKEHGITLPVLVIVQPRFGDGAEYQELEYDTFLPGSFSFVPRKAGSYLVLIKEVFHNRWQGRLTVEIAGDSHEYLMEV